VSRWSHTPKSFEFLMNRLTRLSQTIQRYRVYQTRRVPKPFAVLLRFYSLPPPPPQNNVSDEAEWSVEDPVEEESEGEVEGGIEGGIEGGVRDIEINDGEDYPDLSQPTPLLDLHDSVTFPATNHFPYPAKVIVYNDPSIFVANDELGAHAEGIEALEDTDMEQPPQDESEEEHNPFSTLPLGMSQIKSLHRYPIMMRRITQQTGKGKIHRMYSMMIVGNGDGLVGLGEGKADEIPEAQTKALVQAIRNMDYVERFEKRTIFTEMETKLGATRIIMRPRPVGFGLRCNPNIHQVLKAAGIKDISAKVWGSRNKINVIKACFRMIQAGHSPTAMGDGIGGSARKLNKGRGIVNREEMERARGRKLEDLRTW
jgi:small subunit ribosomal protein S5